MISSPEAQGALNRGEIFKTNQLRVLGCDREEEPFKLAGLVLDQIPRGGARAGLLRPFQGEKALKYADFSWKHSTSSQRVLHS